MRDYEKLRQERTDRPFEDKMRNRFKSEGVKDGVTKNEPLDEKPHFRGCL